MTGLSDRQVKAVSFVGALAVYVAVGHWLQVEQGYILGDSLARSAAAQTVVHSRDPHLAAIGFVFTPLTALVQLLAVLADPVWPELTARAMSGTLMSSAFMAGAVVQMLSTGTDRGLPRGYVLAVATLFAFNPMIVFYGANGMSEAPFVFFTLWTVRRLMLWLRDDDVHHLIATGAIAMSMAYLTRYDALASVLGAGLLVGITTYRRAPTRPRLLRAVLDVVLVAGPGLAVVAVWAATSWLITGEAFAQFSSIYGNTAILRQSGSTAPGIRDGLLFAAYSTALLAPGLAALTGCAVVARRSRSQLVALAVPFTVFGAALAFQAITHAVGSTFPFLRFYIVAIPFAACLAMLSVPDVRFSSPRRRGRNAPAPPASRPARHRYAFPAMVLAVSLPVTAWGMSNPARAPQEYALSTLAGSGGHSTEPQAQAGRRVAATFSTERRIAAYLGDLRLPDGSVIIDTLYGFAVVAASRKPKTFVVPSDRDFVRILNNPGPAGVRYVLAVPKSGRGVADAINRRYPTLYDTGADVATLELEIPNDGENQPKWRLYRVNEPLPGDTVRPAS